MAKKIWIEAVEKQPRPVKPTEEEKAVIVSTCDAFIREVLKPCFLPEVRPSNEFNYCVDIFGEWRGGRYRFMQRYRSDAPNRIRDEFDSPFVRLDFMGTDSFNIYWRRHNDQWCRLHHGVTLIEALELIVSDPVLHPL